jgi:four helix bundle protein
MTAIEKFEDIRAWQKGRELCQRVYQTTQQGSLRRDWALCNQMRRAAVSIPSNIAEGFESQNNRTFVRHLYIARGSSAEVRAQAYVALDQGYITQEIFDGIYDLCRDIGRLLTAFIAYLEQHPNGKPHPTNPRP